MSIDPAAIAFGNHGVTAEPVTIHYDHTTEDYFSFSRTTSLLERTAPLPPGTTLDEAVAFAASQLGTGSAYGREVPVTGAIVQAADGVLHMTRAYGGSHNAALPIGAEALRMLGKNGDFTTSVEPRDGALKALVGDGAWLDIANGQLQSLPTA